MSEPTLFTALLVANRGEIALRIMRTARAQGLQVIALYSDADADAPHVAFADRAICIGPGPAKDSYLSIPRILDAARQSGAEAIHPGYGFLSENADFARACVDAGLVFVGPPANAIAQMGNKAQAKALMLDAGVPCVPGYLGADQSGATLAAEAAKIGYPVMIKAAAGGGGRGMRLVADAAGFKDGLKLAQTEAASAFGSDQIILEKALVGARHVEVQIIADRHANVVHLGERDCSVQRRHQKVVEEAPCPVMTCDLRARMGAAAVNAARAVNYEGAGTVEFMLDDAGNFYFLEMNTRLQVEHPVSELVTGHDLVALQLAVASGALLGFSQEDVSFDGHAIEVRLYAEDPANGFLPASGDIVRWSPPNGAGIRVDVGIATGQSVSPFYDPMLAKIIAHGGDREQARQRLIAALQDTVLFGVASNRDFLIAILRHPEFAATTATTAFITTHFGKVSSALSGKEIALAAALTYRAMQGRAAKIAGFTSEALLGWASPGYLTAMLRLGDGERVHNVTLRETRDGVLQVQIAGAGFEVTGRGCDIRIDGVRCDLRDWLYDGARIHIASGNKCYGLVHQRAALGATTAQGGGRVRAPMHGNLAELCVKLGDRVVPGTRLVVLEAMKMRHELLSEVTGTVLAIPVVQGNQVKAGDVLVDIEPDCAN